MPWPKVQAEIMQATARFEHQVSEAGLPVSQRILDNPIAFHTTDRMLDTDAEARNQTIGDFFHVEQLTAFGFLFGLEDRDAPEAEALKARVLNQQTALGYGVASFVGKFLVMFFALNGIG